MQLILSELVLKNYAAACYEKEGNTKFRDRMTIFFDGKILFERFCWGEAAGLVFQVWATGTDPENHILWKKPFLPEVKPEVLPQTIVSASREYLLFDESQIKWIREDDKKLDKAHGYGRWKVLIEKCRMK